MVRRAGAERLDRVARELASRVQPVDAALAGVGADLAVERRSLRADLAHVAQHQAPHAAGAREHVDRRAHRIRVRVVGVVDHPRPGRRVRRGEPASDRAERRQAAPDVVGRGAGGERRGRRRERVAGHRHAGSGEVRVDRPLGRADGDGAAVRPHRRHAMDIGAGRAAERAHARPGALRRAPPDRQRLIVGVQHGDAAGRERRDRVRVLDGDVTDARHEFLVLALRVVDHDDRRSRDRRERAGLAAVVHAELDDRCAVVRAQAQQRQRQADRVVQVAARREDAAGAVPGTQDRGRHLLDGRLAVAADDDDERRIETRTPGRREFAQRGERVGHRDHRPRVAAAALRHHRGGRAARERAGDEIVAVEPFAVERDEQVAGLDRARVGHDAREPRVRAADPAVHGGGGAREIHHRALHAASASSASPASDQGRRSPAISWVVS